MFKNRIGFVLIELLVVISIIGILAGLTLVSFTGAQKQARDTNRKSDLKQYQNLFELYSSRNKGLFPQAPATIDPNSICGLLKESSCPEDPKAPDRQYFYQTDVAGIKFVVWAALESSSGLWAICSNGFSGPTQVAPVGGECPITEIIPSAGPSPTSGGGATSTPTLTPAISPTTVPPPSSDLTRIGNSFYLNSVVTTHFGIRAANALETDASTQTLIANLDSMKAHGIQFVSLSLQGARTGTANAFNSNGSLIPTYTGRLTSILNALEARDMVGVVSYFYQARDQDLADNQAARNATANATVFLLPWRNVWLYTINEYFHSGFDLTIFTTSAGRQEIYNIVKANDPGRITYVDPVYNDGFQAGTGTTASSGNVVTEYIRRDDYADPGVFTDAERAGALSDAEFTFNNGAYWFWHAAWHQKADAAGYPRFDKGGGGTSSSDRGASFIWDKMRDLTFP